MYLPLLGPHLEGLGSFLSSFSLSVNRVVIDALAHAAPRRAES